jgi:hypothetical protein
LSVSSNHFNFTVEIPTDSLNVTIDIKQLAIGDLLVTYTSFGQVDLKELASLLNEGIDIGLPFLNTYLETLKIKIPQKLFGLFVLSNLTLKYHDSYIEAGLTPTFLPPTEEVPGFYKRFVPLSFADFESEEDFKTFMIQEIDENDQVTYTYTDEFTYYAYAKETFAQFWKGSSSKDADIFLI